MTKKVESIEGRIIIKEFTELLRAFHQARLSRENPYTPVHKPKLKIVKEEEK